MSAIGRTETRRKAYLVGWTPIGWCLRMRARKGGICKATGARFEAGSVIGFNRKTGDCFLWALDVDGQPVTYDPPGA